MSMSVGKPLDRAQKNHMNADARKYKAAMKEAQQVRTVRFLIPEPITAHAQPPDPTMLVKCTRLTAKIAV
jgi:hypothetical protein